MNNAVLDKTFSALAHPVRRAMLDRLSKGDATVNELAAPFEMSLPAISRHIKVLEQAGLISRGQTAQSRPCHLETERLAAVASWADQYRQIWQGRFDHMSIIMKQMGNPSDAD